MPLNTDKPNWYIVLMVFFITILCIVAYAVVPAISVTKEVDTALFHDIALVGFGAIVGLIVQKQING